MSNFKYLDEYWERKAKKNAETLYYQELKAFSALAFCAAIETQLSAFSR